MELILHSAPEHRCLMFLTFVTSAFFIERPSEVKGRKQRQPALRPSPFRGILRHPTPSDGRLPGNGATRNPCKSRRAEPRRGGTLLSTLQSVPHVKWWRRLRGLVYAPPAITNSARLHTVRIVVKGPAIRPIARPLEGRGVGGMVGLLFLDLPA